MTDTSNHPVSLSDLRPSDPAIAARWAELFPYMVETSAVAHREGMTCDDERKARPLQDELCRSVYEFAKTIWAAPARSLGDVVIRAALARYVASEDLNGGIHEVTEDEYPESFSRSAAHVVLAVLELAGLPRNGKWQEILAGTVPPVQSGNWATRTMTAFDLEPELKNVQDAFDLVDHFVRSGLEGETINPHLLGQAVHLLRIRITALDDLIMGEESTRRIRERERAAA